jgi:thymidylate synthase ThyX
MRVTSVSITTTEAADTAGRPALTPELLAASGARYSRNNEGLEAILSRIDPTNLDKSVDSIFRMIDYGHQSIADMVPVAIFIDELSIILAYLVWSWCPTAGGQESSTRYIRLDRSGLVEPEMFGVPQPDHTEWFQLMDQCFERYDTALAKWEELAIADPKLLRIPAALINDPSEKALKQVERMRRNFAFDRARYFLPAAAKTNMMMIMSARGWIQLCQNLLSHWLPEARKLGQLIQQELHLNAPRMVKHAEKKDSFAAGHARELLALTELVNQSESSVQARLCEPEIELFLPPDIGEVDLVASLLNHDNRYAYVGSAACRTSVRFSLSAVSLAEIRDLNRHRTGQKYCPLVSRGFYCALDQVPDGHNLLSDPLYEEVPRVAIMRSQRALANGDSSFLAWLLLGTQFYFEHSTTLDKFVYEAELRTGTGAHYRYANHLRGLVSKLEERYPKLSSCIQLGSHEPE